MLLPAGISIGSGAPLAITVIITATICGFIGEYIIAAVVLQLTGPRVGGVKLELSDETAPLETARIRDVLALYLCKQCT
jgi:hypothetical protein